MRRKIGTWKATVTLGMLGVVVVAISSVRKKRNWPGLDVVINAVSREHNTQETPAWGLKV